MKNKIIYCTLMFFVLVDIFFIWLSLSISPVKLKREVFVFQYGEEIPVDVKYYINANDSIADNVLLDLSMVKNEVGEYDASATYYNEILHFKVCVEDTIKPKATLKNVEVKIKIGDEIVAKDLIDTIDDKSATSVYFYDQETGEKTKSKNYMKLGSFVERIVVEDYYGNSSAILRVKVVVQDNKVPPIIYGVQDIVIKQYDEIDLLKGVRVIDDVEGDITERLNVRGDVDNGIVGEYIVIYSVKDRTGNETVIERRITVR